MTVEFSFRYAVVGFYFDRDGTTVRIYPVPFVRVTWKR